MAKFAEAVIETEVATKPEPEQPKKRRGRRPKAEKQATPPALPHDDGKGPPWPESSRLCVLTGRLALELLRQAGQPGIPQDTLTNRLVDIIMCSTELVSEALSDRISRGEIESDDECHILRLSDRKPELSLIDQLECIKENRASQALQHLEHAAAVLKQPIRLKLTVTNKRTGELKEVRFVLGDELELKVS